jgi:endonuclease/exonuclease/phosphatase (EEP) superfamily protein YafD
MARISFLFWNTHRKPLADLVAALATDHRCDLVILPEDATPPAEVLAALNSVRSGQFLAHESLGRKFRIYARFPLGLLRPVFGNDKGSLAMWKLALPDRDEIMLVVVHGPTKLYSPDDSQALACAPIAEAIRQQERKNGHTRTVLVGDLNMNPFEAGVVGATGLHAVMSQSVARKKMRTVDGISYPFFYNPTWSRMGDASVGPCGTFYYWGTDQKVYFWNTFDQVLLRPELLDRFDIGRLVVPTKAGQTPLVTSDGRPNEKLASDHLPVVFELDL